MSRICIGVIKSPKKNHLTLKEKITAILNKSELYFFNVDYYEPFLEKYDNGDYFIFSISDNRDMDSCEMLFLPDKWFFNGNSHKYSFEKRITHLQYVIDSISQLIYPLRFELFIGESGSDYIDFERYEIEPNEFVQIAMSKLNIIDIQYIPIHIVIRPGISIRQGTV